MEYSDLVESFLFSEQHLKISNVVSKEECMPWSSVNLEAQIGPTSLFGTAKHQHVIDPQKDSKDRELEHLLECVELFSRKSSLLQEFRKKIHSQHLNNTSVNGYLSLLHGSHKFLMNSITCLKDIWGSDTNCCQFAVDMVNMTSLAANHHADGLVEGIKKIDSFQQLSIQTNSNFNS